MGKKLTTTLLFIVLLLLSSYILFSRLDYLCIRVWDEGINAVNAIEMLQNKNYLVRHHNGEPDMWQTLPPLLTWCQLAGFKLFGINEVAIRFPSAFSALLTIMLVFWVSVRWFKNPYIGFISGLILVSSHGFIGHHVARTGDHDAMLTLFLLMACTLFYLFINRPEKKGFYLVLFTLVMILAAYTKSIAGLFFVPGFFIYTLLSGKFKYVFTYKWSYAAIFSYVFIVVGYFVFREKYNPGFLGHVWNDQLFRRFTNQSANYSYAYISYWYYFKGFINGRFYPWAYVLPLALAFIFFYKNQTHKKYAIYLSLVAFSFLLIISAGSKGEWYDAPAYPLLSTITGIFIFTVFSFVHDKLLLLNWRHVAKVTMVLLPLVIFFNSINKVIKKETLRKEGHPDGGETYSVCYYLRKPNPEIELTKLKVCYIGFNTPPLFYMHRLNYLHSLDISFANYNELEANDLVATSHTALKDYIEENYAFDLLDERNYTRVYRIVE